MGLWHSCHHPGGHYVQVDIFHSHVLHFVESFAGLHTQAIQIKSALRCAAGRRWQWLCVGLSGGM
jgi:hypothetical protein